MKIKKYEEFKLNEEFILPALKGALGKLANMFAGPFKDLANDFKKMFKEDDPNSLVNVITTNLDQAIDSAQKEIINIKDETSILGIVDNFSINLVQLSNNIGKDIETALGKGKSKAVIELSKAILMGNKEMDFVGLVGLIDPQKGLLKKDIKFKYSKSNYIIEVNKGKDINAKKKIASTFLDNFQKEIKNQLRKDITEEEIDKLYKELKSKSGENADEMTYDKLKEYFDKKTPVIYLLKDKDKNDYDKNKKPTEQQDIVGVKVINSLDQNDTDQSVVFLDKNNSPTIKKGYKDIIGVAENDMGDNAKKAADALGKIKNDEEKMSKVANFAEFISDDNNKAKIDQIDKILGK